MHLSQFDQVKESIPVTFDPDDESRFLFILKSKTKIAVLLIYMIGFSEGLLHLSNLSVYYMFKDDFGLTPAQLSLAYAIPYFPFIIRPSIAYLTDTVPIFGTRRRHYLLINSFIQSACFFFLSFFSNTLLISLFFLLIVSFTLAFCMTIAEALVVENITEPNDNLSGFVVIKAFSTLIVSYFSGSLLEKYPKQRLFFITGFFPLLITFFAFFLKEEPRPTVYGTHPLRELVKFLKEPSIFHPCAYLVLVVLTPGYEDSFLYYAIDVLGYNPSFLGILRLMYGGAVIVGIAIYRIFFKDASIKKLFFWSSFIVNVVYCFPSIITSGYSTKLGIPDKFLVLSGGFLMEALFEIQSIPFLSYSTRVTPKGLEASVFSAIMTMKSMAGVISRVLTSMFTSLFGITNHRYDHLTGYILFCTFNLYMVMLYLRKVPTKEEMELLLSKQKLLGKVDEKV